MQHISSFIGNVGDVLSNFGMERYLSSRDLNFNRMEIRDFYQNVKREERTSFDTVFTNCEKNNFPLIIGGGGFLDYWVEGSRTGTSIDVDLGLVENTTFPLIITSIGSYPHKRVSNESLRSFERFIQSLTKRNNTSVILRNDGSFGNLDKHGLLTSLFTKGFDNAYLAGEYLQTGLFSMQGDYVAINLSRDQLFMKSEFREAIDENLFVGSIQRSILSIIKSGKKVVLVPHLIGDTEFYLNVIQGLDDRIIREFVVIAEYNGSRSALDYYFSIYAGASFCIATRFHANIFCALAGVRTLSLCVLDRVRALCEQHACLTPITEFSDNTLEKELERIESTESNEIFSCDFSDKLIEIYDEVFANI